MSGIGNLTGSEPGKDKTASSSAGAVNGTERDEAHERLLHISSELRCLVCQNQTIADSNAALAVDLRNQIKEQIQAGKSDADIKQYMTERFGEFVLYKPAFSMDNAALWLGPFVLLVIGAWIALRTIKRRGELNTPPQKSGDEKSGESASRIARMKKIEDRYRRDTM